MTDPMDRAAARALTEVEIEAAALSDPDAQPLSDEALARASRGPHPRFVRMKLRLSREAFSACYHIPMDILLEWETRKTEPGEVVRAYMKAIAADPDGVASALAAKPRAAE